MPRTIDEGFRDFLGKLRASASESQGARKHRASIQACLKNNYGLVRFTRIGSFGNGTSIYGCSDVDYLACLPREHFTSNSTYSLKKVRDALDFRFPYSGVRVNCPAVCCPFGTVAAERTEVSLPDKRTRRANGRQPGIFDTPLHWRTRPETGADFSETRDAASPNTTAGGLLKQPDKQKATTRGRYSSARRSFMSKKKRTSPRHGQRIIWSIEASMRKMLCLNPTAMCHLIFSLRVALQ